MKSKAMIETSKESQDLGYEKSDAQVKPLVVSGVVVLLLMAASFIGIIPLFKILDYYQPLFDDPTPPMASERVFKLSEPRLEIDPPRQNYFYTRQTNQQITSYAWVDRELNIARIPVDRAIELVGSGTIEWPQKVPDLHLGNTIVLP
jgi:hypothetical protein